MTLLHFRCILILDEGITSTKNKYMKLTKANLINYLVDVLGNSEDEAKTISSVYGTTYLTSEQMEECIAFNS